MPRPPFCCSAGTLPDCHRADRFSQLIIHNNVPIIEIFGTKIQILEVGASTLRSATTDGLESHIKPRLSFTRGGDAMARSTMDFAQQNTELAEQATNWMRAMTEQNLNQSRAAFEGLLAFTRNA